MMPQENRPPVGPMNKIDYRLGVPGVENPRSFQPRAGGPPLLFGTDIRMTILVNLALAAGPIRQSNLWRHMGKKAKTALYPLVKSGLVVMWQLDSNKKFVALDPCHPAAEQLRLLLLAVAENYPGFTEPPYGVDNRDAGGAPRRPRRLRDVRYTFGDPRRTMSLLLIHLREGFVPVDARRVVPYLVPQVVRQMYWMFEAFGILERHYLVIHKRRGHAYMFDEENPLVPHVRAVLMALDEAMPQWRVRADRQEIEILRRGDDRHFGRRKPNRWKW
jgi:hypothetical protein